MPNFFWGVFAFKRVGSETGLEREEFCVWREGIMNVTFLSWELSVSAKERGMGGRERG